MKNRLEYSSRFFIWTPYVIRHSHIHLLFMLNVFRGNRSHAAQAWGLVLITFSIGLYDKAMSLPYSDYKYDKEYGPIKNKREIVTMRIEYTPSRSYNKRDKGDSDIIACEQIWEILILFGSIRRDIWCLVIYQRLNDAIPQSHDEDAEDICPVSMKDTNKEKSENHQE